MVQPLWETLPKAIRWFNYQYSLPKVWGSSLKILAGFTKVGNAEKPLVITYSISEDYVRLWLYFAQKAIGQETWDFLIVDSAGDMDAAKLPGAQVIRFLNLYHGKKIDLFLRKVICSEKIFLCDDDQYIMQGVSESLSSLKDENTPVVSLRPRAWWSYHIEGNHYRPMGSYALLFNTRIFLKHDLRFQSPSGLTSQYKVFAPGVKEQPYYDTADYANEQLLLRGYTVLTLPDNDIMLGFSGLSGPRILLKKYGKTYVKQALIEAKHYKEGSTNGSVMRALYAITKLEQLYRTIFQESPQFVSGFSEEELVSILRGNDALPPDQKEEFHVYFETLEQIYDRLSEKYRLS